MGLHQMAPIGEFVGGVFVDPNTPTGRRTGTMIDRSEPSGPGYVYIWEFFVRPGKEAEFVRHYGPDGTWVALFRRAPGYLETILLRNRENPSRFVTIDRWKSADAFAAFRSEFDREFTSLDEQCQELTTRENALGTYDLLPPPRT